MAYIRDRHECLTGCQDSQPWSPQVDLQQDFIMVYGTDEGMPKRIREYRENEWIDQRVLKCFFLNSGILALTVLMVGNMILMLFA